ncbi:MAG: ATP-binding cassette domain-containing protein [Nocardioides sp.]|uniref:methionine ABC transporter ATP-binding protein n=1 Tax=Nocardioides sp. TaxID=35761 RepID=UPI0039E2D6D9
MIEISGLTKTYGTATVLDGIDLRVDDAQIGAIVGPSGAGKSTLSRCINLLERPTSGSVTVNGLDLARLRSRELRTARRQIGTVFQSANLLRRLTAAQNIALPMRHAGLPDDELRARVAELLERVGMLHRANHYPSQLSGGQRQRIGIARGLALRPSVLLSDEATSGLDPDTTAAILSLLRELRTDLGVTILVITHEMDVVRSVADVVFQLDHGRIVEHGAVADVVRRSDSSLSRALLPLPAAAAADERRTWTVRYEDARVNPLWLSQATAELGAPIAILAALVEEAGHTTVGRLTLGIDPALDPHKVTSTLGRHGLTAEHHLRPLAPEEVVA